MATINGRQVRDVAADRLAKLKQPAKMSRKQASDADLAQIKIRKEAEALPEGIQRMKK